MREVVGAVTASLALWFAAAGLVWFVSLPVRFVAWLVF